MANLSDYVRTNITDESITVIGLSSTSKSVTYNPDKQPEVFQVQFSGENLRDWVEK
ncbi:hypothetical protein HAX54_037257, partial [Datura stramonium]|nr:hypothetical protein [Datura stramonium]